jgi:hypothetical protein
MPSPYARWRLSVYTRGDLHTDNLIDRPLGTPRTNVSAFRTVYSSRRHYRSSHENKTAVHIQNSGRATWRCQSIAYLALSRNRKIRTILRRLKAARSSMAAYSRNAVSLWELYMSRKSACHINVFRRAQWMRHMTGRHVYGHKHFSWFHVSIYGWRNMSGYGNVDYSPCTGFEPLPAHMEDSPCNRYMSGHMYALHLYYILCHTPYIQIVWPWCPSNSHLHGNDGWCHHIVD